jgi:hypothetical protein
MTQVFVWLSSHTTTLGILGATIAFIWSVVQFIDQRRGESNERQFEAYHKLIKELVAPDSESGVMWIQRQAAVVFELRHFPRYYESKLELPLPRGLTAARATVHVNGLQRRRP